MVTLAYQRSFVVRQTKIISYKNLLEKPELFQKLAGCTVVEFQQLYAQFKEAWEELEYKRLGRGDRQRALGGGRKYHLPLEDQLLAVMLWVHLWLTPNAVSTLFNIHVSTAIRNRGRVVAALQEVDERIIDMNSFPAPGKGSGVESHPELLRLMQERYEGILARNGEGRITLPDEADQ